MRWRWSVDYTRCGRGCQRARPAGRRRCALTPKPHSSGGKERLGKISKMGNTTLRTLLVLGATTVLRHVRKGASGPAWVIGLLSRRLPKVVAVALANKMARIVYAMLTRGTHYRKPKVASGMNPAVA